MTNKSVLISIRPKWCELIARGEKTIEVRKTRPKIETPFKCYIYCTNSGRPLVLGDVFRGDWVTEYVQTYGYSREEAEKIWDVYNGKVMGEFVCDKIFPISVEYSDPSSHLSLREFPFTCLTDRQIIQYLGNGGDGYGWHISDLVIYDTPKELSEFHRPCTPACNFSEECGGSNATDCLFGINKAPQSWCYVEGRG